ncbi:hypothetical protein D3C87_776850 [compost metagenome]
MASASLFLFSLPDQDCSKMVRELPWLRASWPKVPDMPQQPVASVVSLSPSRAKTASHCEVLAGTLVFSVQCANKRNVPVAGCGFSGNASDNHS